MRTWMILLIVGATLVSEPVGAKEVNNGEDPTNPVTRFDLRYQYENLPPEQNDNNNTFTLRADQRIPLATDWLLATRFDMPFDLTNAVSSDNPNGAYTFGAGDLLAQGLLVNTPTERFAWAAGVRLTFPTASEDQMGSGQYRIGPTVGARYNLPQITPGSWAGLLVRYESYFAGANGRRGISELQLEPKVNIALPNSWFLELYPNADIRYNFQKERPGDTGHWFVPLDVMVGKLLNESTIVSVEVSFPLINDYRLYDFKTEFRVGFFL